MKIAMTAIARPVRLNGVTRTAALALMLVLTLSCARQAGPPVSPGRVPTSGSATAATDATPTPSAAVSTAASGEQFVAEVRAAQPRLAFWPLVPEAMPKTTAAIVQVRDGCGVAPTPCLEYEFPNPDDRLVRVLEGPAGCCLDSARPGAVMDVEIRPGVRGQLELVSPSFGGPILWWVEDSGSGPIYVAVSGPLLGRDELLLIARSMRRAP